MFRDRVLQHYRERGYTLRERVRVRGASGAVHACDLVAQGPLGNLVVQFEDYGGFEGPELDAVRRIARDVGATPVVAAEHVGQTVRRHAARTGVVVVDADALTGPPPRVVHVAADGGQGPAYPPWPGQERTGAADGPVPWPSADRPAREWPVDARARPPVPSRMDPAEVDDLVSEWSRPGPPRPTRREELGIWKYGDDGPVATPPPEDGPEHAVADAAGPTTGFSWLEPDGPVPPTPTKAHRVEAEPPAPARRPTQTPSAQGAQATTRPAVPVDLRWLAGLAVAGAFAGAAFLGLGVLFGVL